MNPLRVMSILLLLCSAACASEPREPNASVPEMPDARSLAELRDLPVTVRCGNWAVRLAVADPGEDAGPWKLLCCHLTWIGKADAPQGARPSRNLPPGGRDIGPLTWSVERVRRYWVEEHIIRCKGDDLLVRLAGRRDAERLYIAAVPTAEEGHWRLVVWSPERKPLRRWDFRVDRARPCAWRTFAQRTDGNESAKAWRIRELTGPAMPRFSGDERPVWRRLEGEAFASLPEAGKDMLPGLLPPSGGYGAQYALMADERPPHWPLRLKLSGGKLLIESNFDLGQELDEELLARWWVNGVPVAPAQREPLQEERQAMQEIDGPCRREVEFALPGFLGTLRAGDKVELQLLYCPGGSEEFRQYGSRMRRMKELRDASRRPNEPVLSNRLRFDVTAAMLRDRR